MVYASSAHNLLKDLKERFDKRNILRIYNLLQEIAAPKQGLSPVSTYYSKLKDLWNEYNAMDPTPSCPCPKSKEFLEHIQQQRLVQFSRGLNESFAQTKGQIMHMTPTPTINEAYVMIVQDESQRAKTMNVSGLEMGAVAVAYNTGLGFPSGYEQKSQVFREYCKVKTHTKDVCYKLVGYPPDYKPKNKSFGRKMASTHNAHVDRSKGPTDQGSFGVATTWNFFLEEQYKQLLQLLNQNTTPVETATHAKVTSIPLPLLSRVNKDIWIIDSCATNHMVSILDFFTDFMEISKGEGHLQWECEGDW